MVGWMKWSKNITRIIWMAPEDICLIPVFDDFLIIFDFRMKRFRVEKLVLLLLLHFLPFFGISIFFDFSDFGFLFRSDWRFGFGRFYNRLLRIRIFFWRICIEQFFLWSNYYCPCREWMTLGDNKDFGNSFKSYWNLKTSRIIYIINVLSPTWSRSCKHFVAKLGTAGIF